jgi:hypothetical protein
MTRFPSVVVCEYISRKIGKITRGEERESSRQRPGQQRKKREKDRKGMEESIS